MMTPAMRILVVEDDKKIASFVVKGLKQSGFAVDHAAEGEQGLLLASTVAYDAAVVDLMLPKLDGLSLLRQLRAQGVRLPIIILSARATVDDRGQGLQAGGDDYLTKPFAFSELLARIQALLRRASHSPEPTRLTVGGLSLDLLNREAVRDGRKIELQSREFALLEYVMRNAGRVVSRNRLLANVWNESGSGDDRKVTVHMSRLRKKMSASDPWRIETITRRGYIFTEDRAIDENQNGTDPAGHEEEE